ncbi:hypothetical protein MKZ38_003677 [Zalerion maritima]|uniref:Ribonuclease H n=1 Tax=Zalerion maritima TaxID=339359 RepID=A0AAD5RU39_9PEZI|nr:hypothetical protein MKZ38_003677 [Zalerion maritima]
MASKKTGQRVAATSSATGSTAAATTAGRPPKRKRDMTKFYAVRAGHQRGVFNTWSECQTQTSGYSGAVYKAFTTREDAEAFVAGKNPRKEDEPTRFYAVAVGTQPGIYNDWPSAQKAIQGAKGPKYKKFDTYAEAIQFIREKGNLAAFKAVGLSDEADENDEDEEEYDEDEDEDEILEVAEPVAKKPKTTSRRSSGPAPSREVVEIYTDGASQGNGSSRAVAGVGVYFGNNDPRNVSEPLPGEPQTNQRAELMAILRALQSVALDGRVVIYSDSQYSIKCVTEWFQSWRKNNWMTKAGPVKNRDLVESILDLLEIRAKEGGHTKFQWVKGHSNNPGNVAADRLAVQGCRR